MFRLYLGSRQIFGRIDHGPVSLLRMVLNGRVENEAERVNDVVEILARNADAEFRGPFLALIGRNLVASLSPEFRPGQFDFPNTDHPVVFAALFQGRIAQDILFEPLDSFREEREFRVGALLLAFVEEVGESLLGRCPNIRFKTLTNNLALDFDPCKICPATHVL